MSKIKVIDFAKNVESNRKRLIQNARSKGKYIEDTASLDTAVSINNTIDNLDDISQKNQVRWINIDGEILQVDYVDLGASVNNPPNPFYDSEYLEFDGWTKTSSTDSITGDVDCGALYRTKADENGRRYNIIKIKLSGYSGLTVNITTKSTASYTVIVDWGDGAKETFNTSNPALSHSYDKIGQYVIKLWSNYASFAFSITQTNIITSVYYGDNCANPNNLKGHTLLECVSFPDVNIKMASSMFENCYSLRCLLFPQGCTNVGYYTAQNCYNLTAAILPYASSNFHYTFTYCVCLSRIIIPRGLTILGQMAFKRTALTKIFIPNSLTSLDQGSTSGSTYTPFIECPNLTEIIFEERAKPLTLGNYTLYGQNFKSVVVPSNVVLGNYVFSSCKNLTHIDLSNVSSMGSNVLSSCWNLKEVILPIDFATTFSLAGCNNISKNCIIDICARLKDLTNTSTLTFTFPSSLRSFMETTYINSLGDVLDDDFEKGITLVNYLQNKNWTVSFN